MAYRHRTSAVALAAAFIGLTSGAWAHEMKCAGSFEASMVQQIAHPIDSPNHLIVSELAKGIHAKDDSPLSGAEMLLSETIVIDNGNGPERGTVSFITAKGSMTNEIRGTVKTVLVDGQPRTTVSGSYKLINGTGMFAGGTGEGTFEVAFKSKTDFHGEYKGVLSLPGTSAER